MKAELPIRERVVYPDGALAEMVVWRVPKPPPPLQHRFKSSLVYVVSGRRVLGYDNERGKETIGILAVVKSPLRFRRSRSC